MKKKINFKDVLSTIGYWIVSILFIVLILAAMIGPYLVIGNGIASGDLPWWVILLVR